MTTDVKRCCGNCGGWDRSSEEWEHTQWKDYLYRRVVEDFDHDKERWKKWQKEREESGRPLNGCSMLQASCLGLGWGNWGCCNQDFGRGKAILCWDEKRGYRAPLYKHLITAHNFCCTEWRLKVEREPTISPSPVLEKATEVMQCPRCEYKVTLYLQQYAPTGQEYWEGECKGCAVKWTRS